VASEPLVYALENAPTARPVITFTSGRKGVQTVAAGSTVKFAIRLNLESGERGRSSAVHVEVLNPQGQIADYYGTDLPLGKSKVEFCIPLALNDTGASCPLRSLVDSLENRIIRSQIGVASRSDRSRRIRLGIIRNSE